MDLPVTGEEGSLRKGDQKGTADGANSNQDAFNTAMANETRRDEDNKFQNAISAWRGTLCITTESDVS